MLFEGRKSKNKLVRVSHRFGGYFDKLLVLCNMNATHQYLHKCWILHDLKSYFNFYFNQNNNFATLLGRLKRHINIR